MREELCEFSEEIVCQKYYSQKLVENAVDMKGTWQIINDLLKGERKNFKIDNIY